MLVVVVLQLSGELALNRAQQQRKAGYIKNSSTNKNVISHHSIIISFCFLQHQRLGPLLYRLFVIHLVG